MNSVVLYDIDIVIEEFCALHNVENMRAESQNIWNACLLYIGKKLFHDRKKLFRQKGNAYDIDLIYNICDLYIEECYNYGKEISVLGFSKFCSIPYDTLAEWGSGTVGGSASSKYTNLIKKLMIENEETLSNIAISGKRNPVGAIAALNHKHNWSSNQTIIREDRLSIAPISKDDILTQLTQLSDNKALPQ